MKLKILIFSLLGIVVLSMAPFVKLLSITPEVFYDYSNSGNGQVHVYFINLDKSTDRLASIIPKLKSLGYEFTRISGIYGKDIAAKEKEKLINRSKYKLFMHNNIGNGTIGCYLSHLKSWKTFLESEYSYALIFEDDVDFDSKVLKSVIDELVQNASDWDMVNIDINRSGWTKPIKRLAKTNYELVKFRQRVGNSSGYLISRQTAKILLQKALPMLMPLDHYFVRSWEFGLKLRGVTPQIVKQDFGDSEIKKQESKESVGIFYIITSLLYQITAGFLTFCTAYID